MKNFITPAILLLTVCLFLIACNDKPLPIVKFNPAPNLPDTSKPIIFTTFTGNAYPSVFEAAFINDTKVFQDSITYTFVNDTIGNIKIESGKMIACDPIVSRNATPFLQIFPTGLFPVNIALAEFRLDERVAFSRIVFSGNQIAKWEFALHKGQNQLPLGDSVYCYGVDAGTGMFIDSVANIYLNQKNQSDWEDIFVDKFKKNETYNGFVYEFDGHSFATFSTGFGDGCYATYIGFDKNGNICQLLTDFGIINWWKIAEKK